MPLLKITTDFIVDRFERELFVLNTTLKEHSFPFYYLGRDVLGVPKFDIRYRMAPEPRILPTWRPPFVKLEEVYLSYFPEGENKQFDLVYLPSKDQFKKIVDIDLEAKENG